MKKHSLTLATNLTVHFWEYHPNQPQTIVFIHGFRGTHHGLELIAQALPEYRILIPDLPGFGESDKLPDMHTLENYVAFLHTFIQEVVGDRDVNLLGHSFGSILVSHYAATYPMTLHRLILVNPIGAPALKGDRAIMTQLAVFYYWLGKVLPHPLDRTWLSSKVVTMIMSRALAKTKDKALQKFIDTQHLTHFSSFADPRQLAEAFDTSVRHDVSQVAERLTVPTLMIVGEKDDITPLRKEHELHGRIKNSAIVVINNVGHLTHYETPHEVADAIRAFL